MAGATTPQEQTVESLRHAIRAAGREPVQRDSFYNHLPKAAVALPNDTRHAPDELICA
jgi:2-iminoacetate synthase ThiH